MIAADFICWESRTEPWWLVGVSNIKIKCRPHLNGPLLKILQGSAHILLGTWKSLQFFRAIIKKSILQIMGT